MRITLVETALHWRQDPQKMSLWWPMDDYLGDSVKSQSELTTHNDVNDKSVSKELGL